MACTNIIGVKNILISFENCDTGETIRNVSHELATEDLPKFYTAEYVNSEMPGGRIKRTQSSPYMEMTVVVEDGIALAWYQGEASLTIQIEMASGRVYTGFSGGVTDAESSDSSDVTLKVIFDEIDELVPAASLSVEAA